MNKMCLNIVDNAPPPIIYLYWYNLDKRRQYFIRCKLHGVIYIVINHAEIKLSVGLYYSLNRLPQISKEARQNWIYCGKPLSKENHHFCYRPNSSICE